MVEPEKKRILPMGGFPVVYNMPPTLSYNKKCNKKRKEGKRNDGTKSSRKSGRKTASNLWIPRVRHNFVPMRPNNYSVNTIQAPQPRSIPFVCGQSISKTHNIGLKIQETLNAIKQEKSKNNSIYKNQYPRVYSHNLVSPSYKSPSEGRHLTVRQLPTLKRKPVDIGLLKAVFLELYEDLTKMMDNLQELRNNSRGSDSIKMAEELELVVKKKELQISVMMALYKELMCLRKALGIKTDKRLKAKHISTNDGGTRRHHLNRNLKDFQGGDQ